MHQGIVRFAVDRAVGVRDLQDFLGQALTALLTRACVLRREAGLSSQIRDAARFPLQFKLPARMDVDRNRA